MHYFSNFETKFFKLFAIAMTAIGRRATVGQPRYWLQSAVSQIMTSVPLNLSDKAPKIITFKFQIVSLFLPYFVILSSFLHFYDTHHCLKVRLVGHELTLF